MKKNYSKAYILIRNLYKIKILQLMRSSRFFLSSGQHYDISAAGKKEEQRAHDSQLIGLC